jgi:hypothetical protein
LIKAKRSFHVLRATRHIVLDIALFFAGSCRVPSIIDAYLTPLPLTTNRIG